MQSGNDNKIKSVVDTLSKQERAKIKILVANKICEEVWDMHMGPFEQKLDKAFKPLFHKIV